MVSIGKLTGLLIACVFMAAFQANAAFPVTYVAGEMDSTTPAIKILKVKQKRDVIVVKVKLSDEFVFCGECAAPLPIGYGQLPQVSGQGHVHVYMKRKGRIPENRQADSFCAFNIFNPSTVALNNNKFRSDCPVPEIPGWYQVCAIVETDSHTQRIKAHPRDFPPVDCQSVRIR